MTEKVFERKAYMFDRSPELVNEKSDFVSSVNILANNIHLLVDQAEYMDNVGIQALLTASKSILKEVIDDVHKGATPEGYRKIDFDLEANLQESKNLVYYDKAIIDTTDAKQHVIKFQKPVYSLVDVTYQLVLGITDLKAKGDVVNTEVEIIPQFGLFSGMGRIKDSLEEFGQFSNIKQVTLFADKKSIPVANGDGIYVYDWYHTTSSILTLHTSLDSFLDILNRIEQIYAEFEIKYQDVLVKHEEIGEWYAEIKLMHIDIKKMYIHILEMYDQMKIWWEETKKNAEDAKDAADQVKNAILNATPYVVITEDTVLTSKHLGSMLQCIVPLDTDIITLTVPDKDDKGEAWKTSAEVLFVPKGTGTVLIKSGGNVVIESQEGTAPMSKGNGRVACAKVEPDGTWSVFGALEDI